MVGDVGDRKASAARHASALGLLACVASLAVIPSGHASDAELERQSWARRPICAQWDGDASEAIMRRVAGTADAIRKLGDDLVRMRRARRNCDLGLVRAACEDYAAIVRDIGGRSSEWPGADTACRSALTHTADADPAPVQASTE